MHDKSEMELLYPQDALLQQYIDYYWVIDQNSPVLQFGQRIFDFPSLSPELVIGLQGTFTYTYKNSTHLVRESTLFAFIDDKISMDISGVKQLVVIKFKPLGLAAFMPFTTSRVHALRKHSIINARPILPPSLDRFEKHLDFANPSTLLDQLDNWFKGLFRSNKANLLLDISKEIASTKTVRELAHLTGLSYSTLERRFKSESGISPKQFLMLNRFRHVIRAIDADSEKDWFDLVVDFGYHDQNHFIKEIKRFSGFTPLELLQIPQLKKYRPEQADDFLL